MNSDYFHVTENVLSDGSKTYDVTVNAMGEDVKWFPAEDEAIARKVAALLNDAMRKV